MKNYIGTDEFIAELAKRAKFTQGDVRDIFKEIMTLLEDIVREHDDNFDSNPKTLLKIRGLFKLSVQKLPARKGSTGEMLPETTRVFLSVARNIKDAKKRTEFSLLDGDIDDELDE